MKKLLMASAVALAAGATVLPPAFAQSNGQSNTVTSMMGGDCPMLGMMGRGMMRQGMMGRGKMMRRGRMGAMAEGRLAYLKAELDVTDTQKDAWDGYADAVKNRVSTMQGMHQSMASAMQDGSAIERMDARISGMEAMVEAMKAVKPATEGLYAVLTDDQKKKADELIGLGCGAM